MAVLLKPGKFISKKEYSKSARTRMVIEHPEWIIREKCSRSFHFFVQYFWDTVINDPFMDNWHLHVYCDELEKIAYQVGERRPNEYDLIVNVPPGTTKTSIFCVFFPVWVWTKWYWIRFITASYSSTLSLEASESSRDIIKSNKFKFIYPDITVKKDKDNKTNFRIVKQMPTGQIVLGGNRFSTSVGGTLLGFHGHINIVDDALDPKRASSEKELGICNKWCSDTLPTRKADKIVTATIMIQQRIDVKDPSGTRMNKDAKFPYRNLCLPGEIKNFAHRVSPPEMIKYYTEDGLMDATRMPWSVLDKAKEDLGQYGYKSQIGQDPKAFSGGMFETDMIRTLTLSEAAEFLKPKNILGAVRYWDKAGSEAAPGTKPTAGVKMIKVNTLYGIKYVITDVVRGFYTTHKRELIIRRTAEADGPQVMVYHEQEPGSGGKDSAMATTSNLAGFSVKADKPQKNKIARADPFSVQVNIGNVWILQGSWNIPYIDELKDFGPSAEFKDQVDASAGAFSKLSLSKEAGTW